MDPLSSLKLNMGSDLNAKLNASMQDITPKTIALPDLKELSSSLPTSGASSGIGAAHLGKT